MKVQAPVISVLIAGSWLLVHLLGKDIDHLDVTVTREFEAISSKFDEITNDLDKIEEDISTLQQDVARIEGKMATVQDTPPLIVDSE